MQFTSICVVLDLQEEQKTKVKGTEAWTSVKSESAIADINALFKKVATATYPHLEPQSCPASRHLTIHSVSASLQTPQLLPP
jgi:hypothetical protein